MISWFLVLGLDLDGGQGGGAGAEFLLGHIEVMEDAEEEIGQEGVVVAVVGDVAGVLEVAACEDDGKVGVVVV